METTTPSHSFLKNPSEILSTETENSILPYSIRALGAQFPALMTMQECKTMSNVYINEFGCRFLKHSSSQLLEMGQKYYSRFFPPEEMEFIKMRLQKLIKKNRADKTISFFQRIRPSEAIGYSWFLTTSQLSLSFPRQEMLLLHISLPVDKCGYMGKNLDALVEENLFLNKNHLLFECLSKREKEVMELISKGNSSQKISDILCISIHTVNNHRKNIINKIGKKNLFTFLKFNSAFQ